MEQRQWVDHRKLQGPQEARWKIRPVLASSNFNLEYINPYTDGKSHTPRLCGKDKRGKNKNQQACTQEREGTAGVQLLSTLYRLHCNVSMTPRLDSIR